MDVVLYIGFKILFKKNGGKRKKEDDTFWGKKNRRKTKQCYDDLISVDGKGTVLPVRLKLHGKSFYLNKYLEKVINLKN